MRLWAWMAKDNGWRWRSSELRGHGCWETHPRGCWRFLWWYQELGWREGGWQEKEPQRVLLRVKEQRGKSVEATLTVGEAYVGIVTRKERGEWAHDFDYVAHVLCIHQKLPVIHWRKSKHLSTIHLNSLISHFHPPLASLNNLKLPVHTSLLLHTTILPISNVCPSSHSCKHPYNLIQMSYFCKFFLECLSYLGSQYILNIYCAGGSKQVTLSFGPSSEPPHPSFPGLPAK